MLKDLQLLNIQYFLCNLSTLSGKEKRRTAVRR